MIGVTTVDIGIRKAMVSDADELTAIAFASKRHWNYPEEWIDLWANELTVDEQYIQDQSVFVASAGPRIVGWCALSEQLGEFWIDYCWVRPEAGGNGVGRLLVRRVCDLASELHAKALKVVADPNAEGFYRRLGFERIGQVPSLPKGRMLPVLETYLSDDAE